MRPALASLIVPFALAACGGSTPELAFSSADSLAASFELFEGKREGDFLLRQVIKVVVDVAVDPSAAASRLDVQMVATRFSPSDAPLLLTMTTPPHARLVGVDARVGGAPRKPLESGPATTDTVDPERASWAVRFAPLAAGEVLEMIARFEVPGTITSDARWIACDRCDEMLLRYDLPSSATGSFQVVGADLKPVVTEQSGRTVVALFVRKAWTLPPGTHARYTTTRASPKGYDQAWATTWEVATRDYVRRLVEVSDGLDEGYDAPFKPAGGDPVAAIFQWVRERRRAGMELPHDDEAPWYQARGLKAPLEKNALTTTDRVHLLHWLLREAGVAHRFAMARHAQHPHVTADFPVPEAFSVPLIAVGSPVVFLDPSCVGDCQPGEVRAELQGGQAILLPVAPSGVELHTLPRTAR